MAESQKGTSSSVNPKEKISLLDDEIGKEFLSSWKSISVSEDDAIDFSFSTLSKGKKKAFNFEKLDMDFNLDGDFDKISSFKVDMSDLDFSSPPRKTAKPKETSEEESSSKQTKGKQDGFTFSFDFNKLDSFNFDSDIMKVEKTSNKNFDGEKVRSKSPGAEVLHAEGIGAFDDTVTMKLPAPEDVTTSKAEALMGGSEDINSTDNCSPSKSGTLNNLAVPHGARITPEKTITNIAEIISPEKTITNVAARLSPEKIITNIAEETDQQSHISDNVMSTAEGVQNLPAQSEGRNDSTQDVVPDVQTEIHSLGTIVNTCSGGEKNANDGMIADVQSSHENLLLKNSRPQDNGESNRLDSITPIVDMDDAEPVQGDLVPEDNSTSYISRMAPHDIKANRENQNSTSKFFSNPLGSRSIVDKMMTVKEKELGAIQSKFFKRSEETGPQPQQASSTGTKVISSGGKRIGGMCFSPAKEKRECLVTNDTRIGSKVLGNLKSLAREVAKGEPVFLGRENNAEAFSNIREGFNAGDAKNGSKHIDSSRRPDKEVTKEEPAMLGVVKPIKHRYTSSFQVGPSSSTDKITKSSAKTFMNSKLVDPNKEQNRNLKTISVEGNKLGSLKAVKRTHDLSSLKALRTTGENKDQSISTHQRDNISTRNTEHNRDIEKGTASKIAHPVSSCERQTPIIPSLKRKTYEASYADLASLNPLKRLSESPTESRYSKEPSVTVAEEQVCTHEDRSGSKTMNVIYDHQLTGLGSPCEVNLMELQIPWVMETDGNVEKAEACMKELEDVCNMLKKKHEEAKEILVRAIVNNNNLLMLNHPIYEQKISFQMS